MPDIGRFFNVDPLAEGYHWQSVFAFGSNQPVHAKELEGLESADDKSLFNRVGNFLADTQVGTVMGAVNTVKGVVDAGLADNAKIGATMGALANGDVGGAIGITAERGVNFVQGAVQSLLDIPANYIKGTGDVLNGNTAVGASKITQSNISVATIIATEGALKGVAPKGTTKTSSLYEASTNKYKGSGTPTTANRTTNVTKTEFESNLQKSGYEKTKQTDKSTTYSKDGKSYTTRPDKKGGDAADFRKMNRAKLT